MVATRTLTSNPTNTSDLTTYTFATQALGATTADRRIVVCVESRRASGTPTATVTVAGVSATVVAQVGNSGDYAGIHVAAVPTGTTGDVVVTFDTGMLRCGVQVYAVYGGDFSAAADAGTSTAASPTKALNVPAGGVGFGCAGFSVSAGSATWAGLTEDFDASIESLLTATAASGEFATTQTGLTVTCTPSGGSSAPTGAFASWGPAAGTSGLLARRRRML